MTLVGLAGYLTAAEDDQHRWRLIAEFLEEYRHEPSDERPALLADEPASTGDQRWDVFLAALAEHLATCDGRGPSAWAAKRRLAVFWFPFNSAAARVDAFVHAPAPVPDEALPDRAHLLLEDLFAEMGCSGKESP